MEYRLAESLPLDLDEGNYTHAYSMHPISGPKDRAALFGEISRLLCEGGQALVAMPLRGSFQEIADLFREMLAHRPTGGASCYYVPLLWLMQRLPNLEPSERTDLRKRLRDWYEVTDDDQADLPFLHYLRGHIITYQGDGHPPNRQIL